VSILTLQSLNDLPGLAQIIQEKEGLTTRANLLESAIGQARQQCVKLRWQAQHDADDIGELLAAVQVRLNKLEVQYAAVQCEIATANATVTAATAQARQDILPVLQDLGLSILEALIHELEVCTAIPRLLGAPRQFIDIQTGYARQLAYLQLLHALLVEG
jgi:hypothetical protein